MLARQASPGHCERSFGKEAFSVVVYSVCESVRGLPDFNRLLCLQRRNRFPPARQENPAGSRSRHPGIDKPVVDTLAECIRGLISE